MFIAWVPGHHHSRMSAAKLNLGIAYKLLRFRLLNSIFRCSDAYASAVGSVRYRSTVGPIEATSYRTRSDYVPSLVQSLAATSKRPSRLTLMISAPYLPQGCRIRPIIARSASGVTNTDAFAAKQNGGC
jgi:hypothetical protein